MKKRSHHKSFSHITPTDKLGHYHEALDQIYRDGRGQMTDVRTITRVSWSGWRRLIWWTLFLAIVGVGVWFGWSAWAGQSIDNFLPPGVKKGVTIQVQTLGEVSSGQEIELEWRLTNEEAQAVRDLEVVAQYPEGFIFTNSHPIAPSNQYHNIWRLASLAPGETIRLVITGQLLGEIGQEETFELAASYIPLNFRSRFKAKEILTVKIKDSVLGLKVFAPVNLITGQEIVYEVEYENRANHEQTGIILKLDLPTGLTITQTIPAPSRDYAWELGSLTPGQRGKIKVAGVITGERDEQRQLVAQIGYKQDGQWLVQNQTSHLAVFVTPEVGVILKVASAETPLAWGQEVVYSLDLANKSDVIMRDLRLILTIQDENGMLDLDKFNFPGNKPNITSKDGVITLSWDQTAWPDLQALAPKETSQLVFSARLLDVPLNPVNEGYSFNSQAVFKATSPDIVVPLSYTSESVKLVIELKN